MVLAGLGIGGLFLFLVVLAVGLWIALQNPALRRQVLQSWQSWNVPSLEVLSKELSSEPRYQGPLASAADLNSADELFRSDRIWNVQISFTASQWQGLQAQRVEPLWD